MDAQTEWLWQMLDVAWGLIGNVDDGLWDKQSLEWQRLAEGWRERYLEAHEREG